MLACAIVDAYGPGMYFVSLLKKVISSSYTERKIYPHFLLRFYRNRSLGESEGRNPGRLINTQKNNNGQLSKKQNSSYDGPVSSLWETKKCQNIGQVELNVLTIINLVNNLGFVLWTYPGYLLIPLSKFPE